MTGIRKNEHLKCKEIYDLISSVTSNCIYPTLQEFILKEAQNLGQDQTFFTIDLGDVLWKAQLWNEKFPDVDVYYAIKANSDPLILKLFALLGYGFDCSTKGEIKLALAAGVKPEKIIYAHTIKTICGLHYARSVGVDLLTFDCEEELVKISKHHPEARVVLRLKPEAKHNNVFDLGKKFGCGASESHILLQKAKDLKLSFVGTSFHAGALCEDPDTYTNLIGACSVVFDKALAIGHTPYIVDIGAGFHGTHDKEEFFSKTSEDIRDALSANFPVHAIRKIAEPGAYFVASAVNLVTTVIGKTKLKNRSEAPIEVTYYLNSGIYGSFFSYYELYGNYAEPLLAAEELKKRKVLLSKLWGQTCCSEDVIKNQLDLPEMEEGEILVWRNMGAYSGMICTTFTEAPLPLTRHIFVNNPRLDFQWMKNAERIIEFLSESAVLIETDVTIRDYKEL